MIYPVDYSLISDEKIINIFTNIKVNHKVVIIHYGSGGSEYFSHKDVAVYINTELAKWYLSFRTEKTGEESYTYRPGWPYTYRDLVIDPKEHAMETFEENFPKKINETAMIQILDR